jgi:hypothetical protein
MAHRSPLLTLAAVAALFAGFVIANFTVNPGPQSTAEPLTSATSAAPTRAASSAPSTPAPSPEPSTSASPRRPPSTASTADDEQFPHKAVYAGRTEDDHIAVAVAVLGDRAAAYICDGRSLEAWFRGSVDGSYVDLTARNGDRIRAELDDHGRLEGALRHAGRTYEFELRTAKPPAGIYRAKGSKSTIGWIVLPSGSVVGVATDSSGNSAPAPQLSADQQAEVDGETVTATPVEGDSDV